MSEREPGQMAYEAWMRARYSEPELRWDIEPRMSQQRWATVESTIRADEAAKVRAATIEECAKIAEDRAAGLPTATRDVGAICQELAASEMAGAIAAAIRAKGAEHG